MYLCGLQESKKPLAVVLGEVADRIRLGKAARVRQSHKAALAPPELGFAERAQNEWTDLHFKQATRCLSQSSGC